MTRSRSSKRPHEVGPNRAYNVGPDPNKPVGIAGFKGHSPSAGQGRSANPSAKGTSSPSVSGPRAGYGDTGKGYPAKSRASKVVGPKFGKGPTGLGKTGRGAPW